MRTHRPAEQRKSKMPSAFALARQAARGAHPGPLARLVPASPAVTQLAALQALASDGALQRQKGKNTADYLDEYEDYKSDERYADESARDALWEDEDDVIDYALSRLNDRGYGAWDETDSDSGNYCRFIFYLGNDVRLAANVHYTAGGKIHGHMYIEGIRGWEVDTPPAMVAAAPDVRPATTETWR